MKPITRREFYLAKMDGQYNGDTPVPVTRMDYYMSATAGDYSGPVPTPITREEMYWAYIATGGKTAMPPQPFNSTEFYLAKIGGIYDGNVPAPVTREEIYLNNIAAGGVTVTKHAEGRTILLTDSIEAPLDGLTLYGHSTQFTTTGAQLVDVYRLFNGYTNSNYGMEGTVSEDGSTIEITANITQEMIDNVTSGEFFLNVNKQLDKDFFAGKDIVLSCGAVEQDLDDYAVGLIVNDANNIRSYYSIMANKNIKLSVPADVIEISIRVFLFEKNSDVTALTPGIYKSVVHNVMLNAGQTVEPWEPYTGGVPSPNPEYPQEIVSAGQKWSTGINLFKAEPKQGESNGMSWITNDDGSITLNGTTTAATSLFVSAFSVISGENIYLYMESNALEESEAFLQLFDSEDGAFHFEAKVKSSISVASASSDVDRPNAKIRFRLDPGISFDDVTIWPMVSKSPLTSYSFWEPYTGGVSALYDSGINVDVLGAQLITDSRYGISESGNGVNFSIDTSGIVHLNGTAKAVSSFIVMHEKAHLMPGTITLSVTGISEGVLAQAFFYNTENKQSEYIGLSADGFSSRSLKEEIGRVLVRVYIYGETTLDHVKIRLMLNYGDEALTYEPYKARQSLTISTPNGLPGIPVSSGGNYTDENGQQWICDEIDFARGVYVQRVANATITDFSDSLGYGYSETYNTTESYVTLDFIPNSGTFANALCDKFTYRTGKPGGGFAISKNSLDKCIAYFAIVGNLSKDEWQQKMEEISPTIFVVLASPIETALSSEEIAAYRALHTYRPSTTVTNDAGAWMEVGYQSSEKW